MKATIRGREIHYKIEGDSSGPVVALSHSLGTDLTMWDPQVQVLEQNYRVLRYDTRGHGASDDPAGPYSLDGLAEDLLSLLEFLDIRRMHFVGLSMGGMIGQALALRAPYCLLSLSLCDTTSSIPASAKPIWDERIRIVESQGMEPMVEPTIERWFTPPFRAAQTETVDRIRALLRVTSPRGYRGCCRAIAGLHLTERLKSIAARTLVVVGEQDPGTPVSVAREIQERIAGSRLEVIPSASHLCNIEQADAFNRILIEFLGSEG